MTKDQELREAENQYHPWETEGITELEYYKRAYLETRKREEEATAKLRAYERAVEEMNRERNLVDTEDDWSRGVKHGVQKCIDFIRKELENLT